MEKNSMTAMDVFIALMKEFCKDCEDVKCKGCMVDNATNAAYKRQRILKEKKHQLTNTQIRTG